MSVFYVDPEYKPDPEKHDPKDLVKHSDTHVSLREQKEYHRAAVGGDIDAMAAFLDKYPGAVDVKEYKGYTTLMWARDVDTVRFLRERGANLYAQNDEGETALSKSHIPKVGLMDGGPVEKYMVQWDKDEKKHQQHLADHKAGIGHGKSFFDKFKDRLTHAQPVETKPCQWRDHLSNQSAFIAGGLLKNTALVLTVGVLVVGASSVFLPVVAAASYVVGSMLQGRERTHAEVNLALLEKKTPPADSKTQHVKNTAKQSFKPI